jgi:hypothetical protein
MLIHHVDPITKIYTHSEELEAEVENSTSLQLPEITEHYTVALIDGEFVSVLKPDRQVINNEIIVDEPIIEEAPAEQPVE